MRLRLCHGFPPRSLACCRDSYITIYRRSLLVRPTRSTDSEYCTALTSLTQVVEQGMDFGEACSVLERDYLSRSQAWARWGDYDCQQFEYQCRDLGIAYPFGPSHVNAKTLFAFWHRLPRELGMARALAFAQLPLEGTHHRGGDDAWNIAALLAILLPSAAGAPGPGGERTAGCSSTAGLS